MSELELSEEDRAINRPMEHMVSTYDAYMRKMTFGREPILRQKTVEWVRFSLRGSCRQSAKPG